MEELDIPKEVLHLVKNNKEDISEEKLDDLLAVEDELEEKNSVKTQMFKHTPFDDNQGVALFLLSKFDNNVHCFSIVGGASVPGDLVTGLKYELSVLDDGNVRQTRPPDEVIEAVNTYFENH